MVWVDASCEGVLCLVCMVSLDIEVIVTVELVLLVVVLMPGVVFGRGGMEVVVYLFTIFGGVKVWLIL